MGTTTTSGIYKPSLGELTWGTPENAGYDTHDTWPGHRALSVPRGGMFVDPVGGNDSHPATVIGYEDKPYKTLTAALTAVGQSGKPIYLVTVGSPGPHFTAASGETFPIVVPKFAKIFGQGSANTTGGAGPAYFQGSFAGDLIQVNNADHVTMADILIENTNANGHGLGVSKSARGWYHRVVAINCAKDGIRIGGNQTGQTMFYACQTNNCRRGLAIQDWDATDGWETGTSGVAPNQILVENGRYEEGAVANIYAGTAKPNTGAQSLTLMNVAMGGGAGTALKGMLIEGFNALTMIGGYLEGSEPDKPMFRIRGARGAYTDDASGNNTLGPADANLWCTGLRFTGLKIQGQGDPGTPSTKYGRVFDVNNAFGVTIEDCWADGSGATTARPAYWFRANTEACYAKIWAVGGGNSKETDGTKVVKFDTPAKNGARWFNPGTDVWETIGSTVP